MKRKEGKKIMYYIKRYVVYDMAKSEPYNLKTIIGKF
jgi:hypothetical protein